MYFAILLKLNIDLKQVLLLIFICINLAVSAQNSIWNDVVQNKPHLVKKQYKGLHKIYKVLLSSQDGDVCEFELSCSSYSRACFKKHSFFKAFFLTLDRLSRCNGGGYDRGYMTNDKGKLIDTP
jgi:putative component of membrane protein insertase Oxa1/YidC/SpoIIIJ protein YidD